ncbi:hypothetical protein ACOSB0_00365, partial [Candidatus Phytoplasma citri]
LCSDVWSSDLNLFVDVFVFVCVREREREREVTNTEKQNTSNIFKKVYQVSYLKRFINVEHD